MLVRTALNLLGAVNGTGSGACFRRHQGIIFDGTSLYRAGFTSQPIRTND